MPGPARDVPEKTCAVCARVFRKLVNTSARKWDARVVCSRSCARRAQAAGPRPSPGIPVVREVVEDPARALALGLIKTCLDTPDGRRWLYTDDARVWCDFAKLSWGAVIAQAEAAGAARRIA